jgi:YHS domain-containing protein
MGKPVSFTHEGTEVRICCKSCRKEFDAHPAKYMAKLK